jgi:peptidoglycan/LPS O-acetylase OafA/YrhL
VKASRNIEIDCLRAIAVLLTVFAHSRLLFLWNPDWLTTIHRNALFGNGVDIFFVISAFVITRSLRGKFTDGNLFSEQYKHFVVRRFWRLAPAALFFCAFYLAYSLISRSGEVGSFLLNLKNTVAVITLTANLRDQSNLMAVYWTLASEWQFYLIFPALLLAANKNLKLARLGLLAFIGLLLIFAGSTKFVQLRFDCMLYGVLLAFIFDSQAYRTYEPKFLENRAIAVGVTLFSIFLVMFIPIALIDIPRSILMGIVSINCTFLVWIASYDKNYFLGGYLKTILTYIGSRSYSIYLAHGPALYMTHDLWYWAHNKTAADITGGYTLRYTLTFILLVLIISELSFRYLERPFAESLRRDKSSTKTPAKKETMSTAQATI